MAGTINAWNNQIAAANSAITLNSGTNAISISTDASATTVNIGTGAAVKTVMLGSTNSTSTTTISSGSGNIVNNSGMTIDSSGRMYNTVQPCFLYNMLADQTNVTGDGTSYTPTFTTKITDQNNDFDGTSTFTAPKTGTYAFYWSLQCSGITSAMTNDLSWLNTTARQYRCVQASLFGITVSGGVYVFAGAALAPMTAGDTAIIKLDLVNGAKVVTIVGQTNAGFNSAWFGGYLVC